MKTIDSIDSLVGDAPKTQGFFGKHASKIGRFGAIATAAACLGYAEMVKAAGVDWSITTSGGLVDRDEDGLNDGVRLVYSVSNISSSGDANNMISFTVSAGSNQGVYNASGPSGWIATIYNDSTVFSGNGNYIAPGNSMDIYLNGNVPQITTGSADAVSAANGGFTSQVVITPVPEVTGLSLLITGLAALCLRRKLDMQLTQPAITSCGETILDRGLGVVATAQPVEQQATALCVSSPYEHIPT